MIETSPVKQCQKLSCIWSRARGCQIVVRIHYELRQEDGCKIYSVRRIEELD
jgi:hypothetical protein